MTTVYFVKSSFKILYKTTLSETEQVVCFFKAKLPNGFEHIVAISFASNNVFESFLQNVAEHTPVCSLSNMMSIEQFLNSCSIEDLISINEKDRKIKIYPHEKFTLEAMKKIALKHIYTN